MTASERVFDVGLQAERTALAWRRTALAMAVAAVGGGRLAAPVLGFLAVLLGAVGLVQAALVAYAAGRRYRAVHRSLCVGGDLRAVRLVVVPIAAMACSGVVVGLLAVAFVLAGR
jgi:putative membrane protein